MKTLNRLAAVGGLAVCLLTPLVQAEMLRPEKVTFSAASKTFEVERLGSATASTQLLVFTQDKKPAEVPFIANLVESGLTVWLPSAKTETSSLLNQLIPTAPNQTLYVMALGKQAKSVIESLQTLEKQQPEQYAKLGGLVLVYPNLDSTQFKTVFAKAPTTTIFQPSKANNTKQVDSLVKWFEQSGRKVTVQTIPDVSEGFLEANNLTEDALMQVAVFPSQLMQAVEQLESSKTPVPPPQASSSTPTTAVLKTFSGEPAPALILEDLDRKQHDLSAYKGKAVVLNFWATWCPPCVKELPSLNRLQQHFSPNDLVVLGVNMSESPDEVAEFLDKFAIDYPNLIDTKEQVAKDWKLRAFPTTLVVDQKGAIRLGYEGGLEWDAPEVIKTLEEQLAIKALPAQTAEN